MNKKCLQQGAEPWVIESISATADSRRNFFTKVS